MKLPQLSPGLLSLGVQASLVDDTSALTHVLQYKFSEKKPRVKKD